MRVVNWQRTALIVGAVVLVVITVMSWSGRPVTTDSVISAAIVGISLGSIYAIAASGIVVTYTTSGIFNFAQGAIGMFMAFVYWQLRVSWHLPAPIAIILAVLVIAPLIGALIERVLMRHLVDSTLVVQLVVTVGLMLFFMGLTVLLWDPAEGRSINFFFGTEGFQIGDTFVLWHRFITIMVAIGIALFLRLLLYRSRIGVTMRAVVDNRTLAGLHGARPTHASMLAWALGSSMAAISGILLVPELGLQVEALTFLIINAFAAAIVGRLKSLPLTYVGAMALGLLISFQQSFLDFSGRWSTASFAIPTIFLFVALLALPQARIELRKPPPPSKILQPRVSKVWETALGMAVLWVVVFFFTRNMGTVNLNRVTLAIVTAMLMLSLVPLTGWAGQVSFAQITFAGVGAFAMFEWAGSGSPWGLLFAALLAVPFGVLVALPALRLQGLYLALATIAFAFMAEKLFFDQPEIFGAGAGNEIRRLELFGHAFTDQREFLLLCTAFFGIMAVGVIALRRSAYGRRLVALRDSEAASATLGVNIMTLKLSVFGLSAAMAGFAGAMLGMQRGTAGTQDFTMLLGLPIVVLVVVGGVATVAGALIGGFNFILFRILTDTFDYSWLRSLELLGPGLLALTVATNPNGASVGLGFLFAPLLPWRKDARERFKAEIRQRRGKTSVAPAVAGVAPGPNGEGGGTVPPPTPPPALSAEEKT
jgi:branched-chain amino acid transport system permease protein